MILISNKVANRDSFLIGAFVFFVFIGLTDIVDGFLARRFNATSKFGRIADPLADKILICGSFTCFAIIARPAFFDAPAALLAVIHWGLVVLLVARELMVTIIRQYVEQAGVSFGASVYGKIKMFSQSFGVGTVLIKIIHLEDALWANWFAAIVYAIIAIATVGSGLETLVRLHQARKKMAKSQK